MTTLETRLLTPRTAGLRRVLVIAAIIGGSNALAQGIPMDSGDSVDKLALCLKSSECVAHLPPEFAELVRREQAAEYERKRSLDLAAAKNSAAKPGAGPASAASAPRTRRPQ